MLCSGGVDGWSLSRHLNGRELRPEPTRLYSRSYPEPRFALLQMRTVIKYGACLFWLLVNAAAQTNQGLMAGVASVDITPTVSMPMYGYADRKCGPSNGVRDPLHAKALVLDDGASRIAIVTLDLGSIVS